MKLPFLQETKWPRIREDEDRVANPSYDTQLQDQLVDELMIAMEKKDVSGLRSALMALIEHLRTEQDGM